MNEHQKLILQDLKGFIDFGIAMGRPLGWILSNVGHDCLGIINDEPCFLPRTHGYANWQEEKSTKQFRDACKLALDWINWAMPAVTERSETPALEPPIVELEQVLGKVASK